MTEAAGPGGVWSSAALWYPVLSRLPSILVARQKWDDLFVFARCQHFLEAQAEESRRPDAGPGGTGPLATLDLALEHAIRLDRVADMVTLCLSRARWTAQLAVETPLTALRSGSRERARVLAASYSASRRVLWLLLLAWELYDTGHPDQARQIFADLLTSDPPTLPAREGRLAVILLRQVAAIDSAAFADLQRGLLDDNDRLDLSRQLLEAGEFDQARRVAGMITLSLRSRTSVLADTAKAAAAAGQPDIGRAALEEASQSAGLIDAGDDQLPAALAQVAGAQAACGDQAAARQTLARALVVSQRLGSSSSSLRAVAAGQAAAGLFSLAEQTIEKISDTHDQWEALEALAVAYARESRVDDAKRALEEIDLDIYIERRRAVRDVSRELAGAGLIDAAENVISLLPVPAERAGPLASVARIAAWSGDVADAVRIAGSIQDPSWRARALNNVRDRCAGAEVESAAWSAIEGVPDPEVRAGLWAEFAFLHDGEPRERLLRQAMLAADALGPEDRWQALLTVALAQQEAADARAGATFAAARLAIESADDDPGSLNQELVRLGTAQAMSGDAPGARDAFAEALRGPLPQERRWLKPLALARIAITQSGAGGADAARRTCDLAARYAEEVTGEWLAVVNRAVAEAQAAVGNLDAAIETAFAMLASAGDEDADSAEDDEYDEYDEEAARLAAEQGILAGVSAASSLIAAGEEERARATLAEVAEMAAWWLAQASFAGRDTISALVSAQARAGDFEGAARTADQDMTGQALSRMYAAAANDEAKQGRAPAALETARRISDPWVRAEAIRDIGITLAAEGEETLAREAFAEAARHASGGDPVRTIRALTGIATAQIRAGYLDGAQETCEAAHVVAAAIDCRDDRDYALSQISQSWAAQGDTQRAVEVAASISQPWRADEALLAAALSAGVPDGDPDKVATIVTTMKSPGWQAVGQVVIAVMLARQGNPKSDLHFAEAQPLIGSVPEGESRSLLQDMIIEILLESKNYQLAVSRAGRITSGQDRRLAALADSLADRGAVDALKQLLLYCARFSPAAYAACGSLARALPAQADVIVNEIVAAD